MNQHPIVILALVLAAGLVAGSTPLAGPATTTARSALAGYDFDADDVRQIELPGRLHEISGLALDARGRLFAHQDERATVFVLDPSDGRILESFELGRNGARGDFEGIALAGSRVFLVTSDGTLLESGTGADGATVEFEALSTGSRRICSEIEGLEYDAPGNALLLACKVPATRALRDRLLVLRFSLRSRTLDPEPFISLPLESLEAFGLDAELRPSGIAFHPMTGTILILAARERVIVELDRAGRLLAAAELRGRHHEQAEGIAIERDGTLIIGDEGGNDDATLTWYPYRPAGGSP